jgi:hypothetical protein
VPAEELLLDRDGEPLLDVDEEPLLEVDEEPLLEVDEEPLLDADEEPLLDADEEPLLDADEEPLLDAGEEPLLDADKEPPLDADKEPPRDADEGLLPGEPYDEGLDEGDELDSGAALPGHGATGSPTFPWPAFASASLAAASKACDWDIGAGVGSGDMGAGVYRLLRSLAATSESGGLRLFIRIPEEGFNLITLRLRRSRASSSLPSCIVEVLCHCRAQEIFRTSPSVSSRLSRMAGRASRRTSTTASTIW